MPYSMTGFVRLQQAYNEFALVIEIRSVNSRYLDVSMHLSDEIRSLEFELKKMVSDCLSRGKVNVTIGLKQDELEAEAINYNPQLAKSLATTLHEIDRFIYNPAPLSAVDIINWPGVLNSKKLITDKGKKDLNSFFKTALDELQIVRKREGIGLAKLLVQRCDEILLIVEQIKSELDSIINLHKEKLENKLQIYKQQLDANRLEQEVVLFVHKMDIAEELDRIITHVDEVKRILDLSSGAQGRRLDFLMQELNREANTIGSKSASAKTSSATVELKVLIEQMREQIQNIE